MLVRLFCVRAKSLRSNRHARTDARLRDALARPPERAALVCESDPRRCAELARALAPLGRIDMVWSAGDLCEAAARSRPRVVVFGELTAKLRDYAVVHRLRALAPELRLVLVRDVRRRIAAEHAALFDAVVESADDAYEACRRITTQAPASTPR